MDRYLVRYTGQQKPPKDALKLGLEDDAEELYCLAVAHTQWGDIPGKSMDNTCWYVHEDAQFEATDFSWIVAPPCAVVLKKNDGSGVPNNAHVVNSILLLYGAVAETEWGTIPGMANKDRCWYTSEGKVDSTQYFYWVLIDPLCGSQLVRNSGEGPPHNSVLVGFQSKGVDHYMATAHTQWGDIPGKARENTCWYGYGEDEHTTSDFSWLVTPNCNIVQVKSEESGVPRNAIALGKQGDDVYFAAVANTDHGKIPGKAKFDGQKNVCWYTYNMFEEYTVDFDWLLVAEAGYILKRYNSAATIPKDVLMLGHQNNENIFLAVALHDEWGNIPCKAHNDVACFSYGDREYETQDFMWLCAPLKTTFLVKSDGGTTPENAIRFGEYYSAVAVNPYAGRIPGKAKGDTCWYAYNDQEHYTKDFFWVVVQQYGSGAPILTPPALLSLPPEVEEPLEDNPLAAAVFAPKQRTYDDDGGDTTVVARAGTNRTSRVRRHLSGSSAFLAPDWRDCVTVIGGWADDICTVRSGNKVLTETGRVTLLYRNGPDDENPRFARIKIYVAEIQVARVFVQMDVKFGASRIRKSLSMSLQQKCNIQLSLKDSAVLV